MQDMKEGAEKRRIWTEVPAERRVRVATSCSSCFGDHPPDILSPAEDLRFFAPRVGNLPRMCGILPDPGGLHFPGVIPANRFRFKEFGPMESCWQSCEHAGHGPCKCYTLPDARFPAGRMRRVARGCDPESVSEAPCPLLVPHGFSVGRRSCRRALGDRPKGV